MCDCQNTIEERLTGKFKEQAKDAKGHRVSLQGYMLILGKEIRTVGFMKAEMIAEFPLKKGGEKRKTSLTNVLFTFCPWCGERYAPKDDAQSTQPE
jgi:hypothetical protein